MNRAQRNRIVLLTGFLIAAGVFAREVTLRGSAISTARHQPSPSQKASRLGGPPSGQFEVDSALPKLPPERLERALLLARSSLSRTVDEGHQKKKAKAYDPQQPTALVSLSRHRSSALLARGQGPTLEEAVKQAASELATRATADDIRTGHLKVDLAFWQGEEERFDSEGQSTAQSLLDGIWLPKPDVTLLPEEMLSRRMLDDRGDLHSGRLARYLTEKGRSLEALNGNPSKSGSPFRRLRFQSIAEGPDGEAMPLFRGNSTAPSITPDSLLEAARAGGEYLLRHHQPNGLFDYSYRAKRDKYDDSYNLLRHAGTCYALLELYEATGDARYRAAARLGLEKLLTKARPPKPEHREAHFEAIVSPGEEAKLGGAALTILALMRYREASGESLWLDRARNLATFLVFQQEPSGHFFSKYFYGPPDPEPFESIYYPGEAILSLMRLYREDPDPRWLETARKGADWLMDVRDTGKAVKDLPHDHWLLMGLNELHQVTEDPRYAQHGARIAQAIIEAQRTAGPPLDWVGSYYTPPRSTPTATRSEALVAMVHLAKRVRMDPTPYLEALRRAASFQLRCQLTEQNSLYLPRPDLALGGFRRSLTNWEVRIDYVQHNLSALLGLRTLLETEARAGSS
ncbi:MAG: hypothetical protein K0U98_25650 [Deltaproteobacteria bacterium]|nr:hypothetical protein [Deltaproteobacteria bacterium]